jgi:hypothetical protein
MAAGGGRRAAAAAAAAFVAAAGGRQRGLGARQAGQGGAGRGRAVQRGGALCVMVSWPSALKGGAMVTGQSLRSSAAMMPRSRRPESPAAGAGRRRRAGRSAGVGPPARLGPGNAQRTPQRRRLAAGAASAHDAAAAPRTVRLAQRAGRPLGGAPAPRVRVRRHARADARPGKQRGARGWEELGAGLRLRAGDGLCGAECAHVGVAGVGDADDAELAGPLRVQRAAGGRADARGWWVGAGGRVQGGGGGGGWVCGGAGERGLAGRQRRRQRRRPRPHLSYVFSRCSCQCSLLSCLTMRTCTKAGGGAAREA